MRPCPGEARNMQTLLEKEKRRSKERADFYVSRSSLEEIGLILRSAREKRSLTIKDIREKTCIPVHHILAVENGNREELPEEVFLIGFIKRYARAVGLDPQAVCNKYLRLKDPNEESSAFDLLFHDTRVVNFKKERSFVKTNTLDKSFFKVYHFYLLILAFMFLVASYLVIKMNDDNLQESKSISSFVYEKQDSDVSSLPVEFENEQIAITEEKKIEKDPDTSIKKIVSSKATLKNTSNKTKVESIIKPKIAVKLRPPVKITSN